ncbi:PLC-like phosphodiesterase, TIM beta/alpha-barrel domain protein [Niveomyces insectorum RCEF 264]|uniref:PLC-like phosphodiesterase, TIM beta/alpha-barrel domain protein n=1 Tax=Niveomyces insectorum RCEF 264 TaxID=1081102 RepID=A0A167R9G7_9HYPO|nr:PLC-like phosphodiesterase, TIM beta/alpha-barrel domain protein [Niveomyces insectorum RCEF 264]
MRSSNFVLVFIDRNGCRRSGPGTAVIQRTTTSGRLWKHGRFQLPSCSIYGNGNGIKGIYEPKPWRIVDTTNGNGLAFVRDASQTIISSVAGNQFFNATRALDAGVRLLQAQVHLLNGALHLCHTSCGLLDAGSLVAWLTLVRGWLDTNPHDVLTLLLVNSDNAAAAVFGRVFQQAGLVAYGYAHKSSGGGGAAATSWPTLQSMIADNTRLVTFIASVTADPAYPYLLPEFQHVFETPYMVTNLAQFTNCSLDRPATVGTAAAAVRAGMLPLLNHFAYVSLSSSIQIPDVSNIDVTNSPDTTGTQFAGSSSGGSSNTITATNNNNRGISGTLGTQARLCTSQWGGTKPTFILVDFFNRGPALRTVDDLNGLTTTIGRVISEDMLPGAATRSSAVSVAVDKLLLGMSSLLLWVLVGRVMM